MNFSARPLLALAMILAAMAVATPAALAQTPGPSIACPTVGRSDSVLAVPVGPTRDLEVVGGICRVSTDGIYTFGAVHVRNGGALLFDDAAVTFQATSILIHGGGTVQTGKTLGSPAPIATNQLVIRLTGVRPTTGINPLVSLSDNTCTTITKGIGVQAGGTLSLRGKRGVAPDDGLSANIGGTNPGSLSWTYLAEPAGPADPYQKPQSETRIKAPVAAGGELVIYTAADVSADWKIGDWIVIGTTSYSPFESEFVKISGIGKVGNRTKITLDRGTPLRHYHFGGPDPHRPSADPVTGNANADGTTNFGVDERAEVGLITRNVKLTAKMPNWKTATEVQEQSFAWGGELKVCGGFKKVELEGVEIERFGKANLGSYPVHLHMLMDHDDGTLLLNSNSIHHSYNHCFDLHMTNNVTISNNVCARVIGHLFYEEVPAGFDPMNGSVIFNTGLKFHDNLGVGAMAPNFGLAANVPKLDILPDGNPDPLAGQPKGFWEGDYLARDGDGYYGLYVQDTDDRSLAVHGQCFAQQKPSGLLDGAADVVPGTPPTCPAAQPYYYEPPTGFWTVNPSSEIIGNSIAGCQSTGKGYWYVPPTFQGWKDPTMNNFQMNYLNVRFINNRAHGCYDGVFGEGEAGVAGVEQLKVKVDGDNNKQNLATQFTGFTASRIRNRGVWMRPAWFVFDLARVATTREGVSLLTAGGSDGIAPGVWGLVKDSTIVGVSMNNVDRWGPCASGNQEIEGPGCVDKNSDSAAYMPKGYASPGWNFAGIYIYDGPMRIHDVRFVNFHVDPRKELLTQADINIQNKFTGYVHQNTVGPFEGDAALGWFANNQSAYPVGTDARALRFDSVDLRHQVFTEEVNLGRFDDGDKNTAVIDRDGSLTGFKLAGVVGDDYPISLNNLPFNAAFNAVDECHSEGGQDTRFEGRPTSLISPANYATLEFEAFMAEGLPPGQVPLPPGANEKQKAITQWMSFAKDNLDYSSHQVMEMHSRNNQGIWEPKVAHGHGYTVSVKSASPLDGYTKTPGMPPVISVGLSDLVKSHASFNCNNGVCANPFYVRVGVCYTDKSSLTRHPVDGSKFRITRGYRSWGSGPVNFAEAKIRKLFVPLDGDNSYDHETCFNLSSQNPKNLNGTDGKGTRGCPAHGVMGRDTDTDPCPPGSTPDFAGQTKQPICTWPVSSPYTPVATIHDLTNADGTPKDLTKDNYFYDKTTGMLFFYVKQEAPNVAYTSPLGSCDVVNPPAYCPNPGALSNANPYPESYYTCPAQGCSTYVVRLDDPAYIPAPSACVSTDPTAIYTYVAPGDTKPSYEQPEIAGGHQLAFAADSGNAKAGDIVEALPRTAAPPKSAPRTFQHSIAGRAGIPVDMNVICTGAPATSNTPPPPPLLP